MHILTSDRNVRSHLDEFFVLQLPSHTTFEVKKKNKYSKSVLTTYLKEDFFKNNLTHLQTKCSLWFQQDFLSWADLPLASVEGLDFKSCKPLPALARALTVHQLKPMRSTQVLPGHPMSTCWLKLPSKIASPWWRELSWGYPRNQFRQATISKQTLL